MKPKIGILIPQLGITDRGAEITIYELAKCLHPEFDITIWVRFVLKPSQLIKDLALRGIHIRQIKCITGDNWFIQRIYKFNFFKNVLDKFHLTPFEIEMLGFSLICLPQLLSDKIDILFPANGFWGALICKFVRFTRSIPFIYSSLGGIEPLIAKLKPDAYITTNPVIKRFLKTHFSDLKVTYISTGVDLNKFNPNGKVAQINLVHPIILTISALYPWKKVDLTIKAVGKLRKGSLLIIGNGPLKSNLIQAAQKYLGNGRFLFQSSAYSRLDQFYRAADVFTHSAPWEVGWGMVHLEALATNLPVVANKEENLVKLLKGIGITCDVSNIKKYAKALERALSSKRDFHRRLRMEKFSWSTISKQYKKCFYDLV